MHAQASYSALCKSVLEVEPHLHLFCICDWTGQNMQTASTHVDTFQQKEILLKIDPWPTEQPTSLILEKSES